MSDALRLLRGIFEARGPTKAQKQILSDISRELGLESDSDDSNSASDDEGSDGENSMSSSPHGDRCHICRKKGKLLLCDTCPLVFHLRCLSPPLRKPPTGMWSCQECERKTRSTKRCKRLPPSHLANDSKKVDDRYRGVTRRGRRWYAKIQVNTELLNLGRFDTQIEAAKAYDKAAFEHLGSEATLNFPQAKGTDPSGRQGSKGGKGKTRATVVGARGGGRKRKAPSAPARGALPLRQSGSGRQGRASARKGGAVSGGSVSQARPCEQCDPSAEFCKGCGCHVCFGKMDPDKRIRCEQCGASFHLYCLDPPLSAPPAGLWFCGKCASATGARGKGSRRNNCDSSALSVVVQYLERILVQPDAKLTKEGEARLSELERDGELEDLLAVGRILQGQHDMLEEQIRNLKINLM